MTLRLKEEPKEWRKSVLLTALGLALLGSILRWRRVLPGTAWLVTLATLAIIALTAVLAPRLFRGYYRLSMRLGFALSRVVAQVVLVLVFLFMITPLALVFRLLGKDTLRLKRQKGAASYWVLARETSPLDRMF
ncbi:MAG TPA: SxtJ family membrane protein [Verrucomicrobiae bacterium]